MTNQMFIDFIKSVKNDKSIITFDEAATKQAIILRLLNMLGWNTFDINEVKPEYSINGKRVDYSLRINSINKVFIEVKKTIVELENHQEQLLNYSFKEGVKLAVLTNGISWWFYLPLHEGSWEQRKFYTIDLIQQNIDDIIAKFNDFLSKEKVCADEAVKNAELIYKSQQKDKILNDTIPKAWKKIIEEKDDLLIELINDTTEKLCGFKADYEIIEKFLDDNKNSFLNYSLFFNNSTNNVEHTQIPNNYSNSQESNTEFISNGCTNKTPSCFYLRNNKFEVRTWKEILIKLSNYLNEINSSEFQKSLKVTGRKRPYFSKNPNELRVPQKIEKTDIFVETNLSANTIVKVCTDLIYILGYSENDFKIETK
ncbi:MAG: type I restriction endonuclease [Candidatus Wallbacteria bacterium]